MIYIFHPSAVFLPLPHSAINYTGPEATDTDEQRPKRGRNSGAKNETRQVRCSHLEKSHSRKKVKHFVKDPGAAGAAGVPVYSFFCFFTLVFSFKKLPIQYNKGQSLRLL